MAKTNRYTATIVHHSIVSARTVDVGNSLANAKRRAMAEFGGDFRDYNVIIMDRDLPDYDNVVAQRRLGDRHWMSID